MLFDSRNKVKNLETVDFKVKKRWNLRSVENFLNPNINLQKSETEIKITKKKKREKHNNKKKQELRKSQLTLYMRQQQAGRRPPEQGLNTEPHSSSADSDQRRITIPFP